MQEAVTTNAIRRAKLQPNHHHQQTSTQLFYRPNALLTPTNSVKQWREKVWHSTDLLIPNSPRGFSTSSLTNKGSCYLGGGLPGLSSTLMPFPHSTARGSSFNNGKQKHRHHRLYFLCYSACVSVPLGLLSPPPYCSFGTNIVSTLSRCTVCVCMIKRKPLITMTWNLAQ